MLKEGRVILVGTPELAQVPYPLDNKFDDWGDRANFTTRLKHRLPLRQLLTHLSVLILVLDNDNYYWAGEDEADKLLRRGEGWPP